MLEVGAKKTDSGSRDLEANSASCKDPAWPCVARPSQDKGWVTVGSGPSGSGSSWGGQEGRELGAQLQPHIPPPPTWKSQLPRHQRGPCPLGRLEPGTFCKVHCSLVRRWSLAPWDKHAFVFIILRFWSMAGELLLVPISRCSCSHFSPPSYFCWVIGDQLPGPGDVCGIWGNVSRGFQLHGLGQANRANTLGIDEEGTLQKRTGE